VVIITYGRDALHRHVSDTVGSTVTDRFFSSDWQLLETKVGSNTVTRNVWSPVYVDGLVLRDRDTDANGTFDERLYSLQDANWNTTGLVNAGGTVQERYTYTPFGQVTFRDGSGSTLSASAKDWVFLHQGGERIAAGDYEFRNRVYSPSLGRWLSNDPLGFDAGDQNWYRAIGNNPGNGLDPIGLDEWWFWKDPLYLVPFREQNLWGDIRNNLIPKRSKAYIESPIGQVFDPNKTDNPNPTLGSYLDADFRDSVQVTKQGMMRHVGEELAEKAAGAVAVGAAGVAAKKIYKSIKSVKAPNRVGRFPAEPYDLTKTLGVDPKVSTTQHGTRRYLWEPNQNTRIRFESHPGDSGAFNPRHHGEHYHIEIKPDGMTWNQAKKQGLITKVNPEDYIPGHGTGHLPGEPFPGQ
jgi:RHS repeat-associated protein